LRKAEILSGECPFLGRIVPLVERATSKPSARFGYKLERGDAQDDEERNGRVKTGCGNRDGVRNQGYPIPLSGGAIHRA
jgi:hypothetical protein